MKDYYLVNPNDLLHYGTPRHSGRYPWGSGDRPYQGIDKSTMKNALKGRDRTYFRGEHTIPKGTTVYRTTSTEKDIKNGASTYVTYLETDRNLYKGGYIRSRDNSTKSYEHQMVLKEDLKVPSREILQDSIQTVVKNNPKLIKETAEGWIKVWFPENSIMYFDAFWDDELGDISQKKVKETIDNIVNTYKDKTVDEAFAMHVQSLGATPKMKEAIINDLKKKGYNAMVDEAGVGVNSREGIDPLIIFDSEKSLSYKSTNKISSIKEEKARKDYIKWNRRAGDQKLIRGGQW